VPEAPSLEQSVRDAAAALAALVPRAVILGAEIADGLTETCNDVEPALAKRDLVLGVVGDAPSRRAILRVVLGETIIRGPSAKRARVVRVRSSESFDYVARGNGVVVRFARSMPDRDVAYARSIELAERAVEEAKSARRELEAEVSRGRNALRTLETSVREADEQVEAAGEMFAEAWRNHRAAVSKHDEIERAVPEVPALFVQTPPFWAFWLWVLRWLLHSRWREPLALRAHNRAAASVATARAKELEAAAERAEAGRDEVRQRSLEAAKRLEEAQGVLAQVEVRLSEERAVGNARVRVEELLQERMRHAGERREEFESDLRDIDAGPRGDDVDELDVELPLKHPGAPPENVVLVFADTPKDDVDGFVLVGSMVAAELAALRARLPQATALTAMRPDHVRATLERARDQKTVIPAKLALRLRVCIANVARARARAEAEHQKRLESLEKQRIPHPDAFRARQMARSDAAIDKGAADVLATALACVDTGFDKLKTEWRDSLSRETRKQALDARVREINERGTVKVLELLEATSELIAREMQSVGETLEHWALDEIQSSYHTHKRRRVESLAPVASEVTSEVLARPIVAIVPIVGPREAFMRQRVLFGLGGCVTAALAGTLVRPGIGTGVGALVGALSAFLKSPASLRAACLDRIDAYCADAKTKVETALRDRREDLIVGIRSALEDALAETLERLNESITRLMKLERDAIEAERTTLANLLSTRGTLEAHDERLRDGLAKLET
jgi:gas vesicle protein